MRRERFSWGTAPPSLGEEMRSSKDCEVGNGNGKLTALNIGRYMKGFSSHTFCLPYLQVLVHSYLLAGTISLNIFIHQLLQVLLWIIICILKVDGQEIHGVEFWVATLIKLNYGSLVLEHHNRSWWAFCQKKLLSIRVQFLIAHCLHIFASSCTSLQA